MPGVSNEFEGRWDGFDKQALILTLRHLANGLRWRRTVLYPILIFVKKPIFNINIVLNRTKIPPAALNSGLLPIKWAHVKTMRFLEKTLR